MKELHSSDIKRIEYEMLLEIADYCDKNALRYCLASGTALGAVRHNGFIPWDDDMDIAMPRPDYERFVDSFRTDRYVVLDSRFDDEYPYAFAKVSDNRTTLIENIEKPFPMGVYIDVFPVDGIPEDPEEREKHFRRIKWDRRLLSWKRISRTKKVGAIHKMIQVFFKAVITSVPVKRLVKRFESDVKRYPFEESALVGHLTTKAVWGSDIKPRRLFEARVKHIFEADEFWLPGDYDEYLRIEYGDYMKLPPKEKQVTNHDFTAYWKDD